MGRMIYSMAAWVLIGQATLAAVAEPTLRIDAGAAAGPVSPLMYGLMTEEINHSYDGGLYAELVQNRALLDDPKAPRHYAPVGPAGAVTIALDPTQPLNDAIRTSLRVDVKTADAAAASGMPAGVANDGYWGFPVTATTQYRASFYAKAAPGFSGPVTLSLQSPDGKTVYAKTQVSGLTAAWKKFDAVLETPAGVGPTSQARYAITVSGPTTLWLSLVSLFPPTYADRPNGFRRDLMQMLADLKPKFLRFPGGNFVEGNTVADRFPWKTTLGPLADRPGHAGCWGYRASDGMGLLEFLHWCEDTGAQPLLAVYAGYSLGGDHVAPGPALEPFVTDALEEIEYVSGDTSTEWGKRRAADGHPEPFKLTYVEVGNEDWFDKSGSYDARFAQFYDAIRAKYPKLKIISTVGNEQARFAVHSRVPDAVDEHYYRPADEFLKLSPTYYEKYARGDRPAIFVGEWASYEDAKIKPWSPGAKKLPPTPNMQAALGDAAFMASMERNSDLVVMNCYAPLLVNVNPGAWQWGPDLIGYDALHAFGSPSYYAIRMFSTHLGDERLRVTSADAAVQASATRDSRTREVFVKLVNPTDAIVNLHVRLDGVESVEPTAKVQTMAANVSATNALDRPTAVVPVASTLTGVKATFDYTVPSHGIVVLTLKTP